MNYEPWNKKCLILIRESKFKFKLLEKAILSPRLPDSQQKNRMEIGQYDKKIKFCTLMY